MKPILLLGILLVCGFCAQAGTVLSVDPQTPTVIPGTQFTLDVDLYSDSSSIYGFDFDVLFPASILQAVIVTEEGYFAANGCCFSLFFDPTSDIDNVNGVISSLIDSSTATYGDNLTSPTSPDTLVSIVFQAIGSGTATVQLGCDSNDCTDLPMLSDDNGVAIAVDAINSSSVTAVPEPRTSMALLALVLLGVRSLRRRPAVREA